METFADFYAKGDFPNALKELENHRREISPGLWHFNVGIVKAKMMSPAESRYHFLEAQMKGFSDPKLAQNMDLVERELEVKTIEKPLDTMDYVVKLGLWSQNGFFTLLSLIVLLSGLMILRRERNYKVLLITCALALGPLGLHWWIKSWDKSVSLSSMPVMEGPSVIFGSRGELPAGVLVITKHSGEWKEIVYPSRFRGWIKNVGLKELE